MFKKYFFIFFVFGFPCCASDSFSFESLQLSIDGTPLARGDHNQFSYGQEVFTVGDPTVQDAKIRLPIRYTCQGTEKSEFLFMDLKQSLEAISSIGRGYSPEVESIDGYIDQLNENKTSFPLTLSGDLFLSSGGVLKASSDFNTTLMFLPGPLVADYEAQQTRQYITLCARGSKTKTREWLVRTIDHQLQVKRAVLENKYYLSHSGEIRQVSCASYKNHEGKEYKALEVGSSPVGFAIGAAVESLVGRYIDYQPEVDSRGHQYIYAGSMLYCDGVKFYLTRLCSGNFTILEPKDGELISSDMASESIQCNSLWKTKLHVKYPESARSVGDLSPSPYQLIGREEQAGSIIMELQTCATYPESLKLSHYCPDQTKHTDLLFGVVDLTDALHTDQILDFQTVSTIKSFKFKGNTLVKSAFVNMEALSPPQKIRATQFIINQWQTDTSFSFLGVNALYFDSMTGEDLSKLGNKGKEFPFHINQLYVTGKKDADLLKEYTHPNVVGHLIVEDTGPNVPNVIGDLIVEDIGPSGFFESIVHFIQNNKVAKLSFYNENVEDAQLEALGDDETLQFIEPYQLSIRPSPSADMKKFIRKCRNLETLTFHHSFKESGDPHYCFFGGSALTALNNSVSTLKVLEILGMQFPPECQKYFAKAVSKLTQLETFKMNHVYNNITYHINGKDCPGDLKNHFLISVMEGLSGLKNLKILEMQTPWVHTNYEDAFTLNYPDFREPFKWKVFLAYHHVIAISIGFCSWSHGESFNYACKLVDQMSSLESATLYTHYRVTNDSQKAIYKKFLPKNHSSVSFIEQMPLASSPKKD